ncbi:WD domain G-beta repeat [Carpediemonas membranifera]|uniref:Cilia- and flagella-associated protein 251 n=1 Tax=Carpediemonas membranifera TaxID=201153 RepID=A0A8J6E711_9EUKA|nr:WD domain G-beta repeat [Carpediemonas membranifera]|eukprot:KAG9390160.1 WD domain G-beta repeat [Carpediemonas membranifera]
MQTSACIGFSLESAQVANLTDSERSSILYIASNTVVYHDVVKEKQYVLQGHTNKITSLRISPDRRNAVSADAGPDPLIVVWDTYELVPKRTYFSPFPDRVGVKCLDVSADGEFIVAISDSTPQYLAVFRWTDEKTNSDAAAMVDEERPIAMLQIEETNEPMTYVAFDRADHSRVLTNGQTSVVFWLMEPNPDFDPESTEPQAPFMFTYHVPEAMTGPHKLTNSTFTTTPPDPLSNKAETIEAVSATTTGALVQWLWDGTDYPLGMRKEKVVTGIHDQAPRAINQVTAGDNWLATAGADGCVRVFDFKFKSLASYESINSGPITALSFAKLDTELEDDEAVLDGTAIRLPGFIGSTTHGEIIELKLDESSDLPLDGSGVHGIIKGFSAPITCMTARENTYEAYVGSQDGRFRIVSLNDRSFVREHRFQETVTGTDIVKQQVHIPITPLCVATHPTGELIAVGLQNGTLSLMNPTTLAELSTYTHSTPAITKAVFSPCGRVLATIDDSRCVSLYREDPTKKKPALDADGHMMNTNHWQFVGKCRAHTSAIVDMAFIPPPTDDEVTAFGYTEKPGLRLASIGLDRHLSVIEVERSSVTSGLLLSTHMIIEDGVAPAFIQYLPANPRAFHSTPDGPQLAMTSEGRPIPVCSDNRPALIIGTRDHKLRLRDAQTYEIMRTAIGPTFGLSMDGLLPIPLGEDQTPAMESIQHSGITMPDLALTLPASAHEGQYYLYKTPEKVIGLVRSPFDGDPNRAIGMIAHCGEITDIALTFDGQYALACGRNDGVLTAWSVDLADFNNTVDATPKGIEPFIDLIDGGREGTFFNDLQDYFVYAQLRHQGEDYSLARNPTGRIPVSTVPDLERALGFYPSEFDIKALEAEIASHTTRAALAAGRPPVTLAMAEVDLNAFIRLFVNHRPLAPLDMSDIASAFEKLGAERLTGLLDRGLLADKIAETGDKMTELEFARCVAALVGDSVGDAEAYLDSVLGGQVAATDFAARILGFDGPSK